MMLVGATSKAQAHMTGHHAETRKGNLTWPGDGHLAAGDLCHQCYRPAPGKGFRLMDTPVYQLRRCARSTAAAACSISALSVQGEILGLVGPVA